MLLHQMRFMLAGTIAVGIAILLAAEYGHGKKKTAVIDPIKAEWREGENRAALDKLEGNAPPALTLKDWTNGDAVNLADLKGKVVLVDFWATWCGPCISAIPHTNQLQAKFKNKGLVVIAVCHSEESEKMAQVVKDKGSEYLTAADVNGKTVAAWQVNSYPDYYLIDRSGKLRIADCQNGAVDDAVEALLNEPAPSDATAAAD